MIEHALDAFAFSQVAFWIWLIMPIVVLVISLLALRHRPPAIRIISSLLLAASCSFLLFFTAVAWGLRDGIAATAHAEAVLVNGVWVPVDESSHGTQALIRFMMGFVPTSVISGVIAGAALLLCRIPWQNKGRKGWGLVR
ncbi:hypothetical protein IAD21_02651 [Abditibacteriota bacterium]|nr:hypothetical protein IAD21_02651 [Abditibacteriota bacterium]